MKDEQTAAIFRADQNCGVFAYSCGRAESHLGKKLDDIKESVDQVGMSIDEINKKGRAPY